MARIMVVIGFLVAFAAGLVVGLEARRTSVAGIPPVDPTTRPLSATGPASRPIRSPGWFVSQLNLTPDQQKKMDAIWSEVARGGRAEMEKRRDELRRQRDEAILALVGPENRSKYDDIQQNYRDQQQAMEHQMRARFEKAVKQTEDEVLTSPEQREKYRELLARHRTSDRGGERGGERGRSPGGPTAPGGTTGPGGPERNNFDRQRGIGGATSNPSTQS